MEKSLFFRDLYTPVGWIKIRCSSEGLQTLQYIKAPTNPRVYTKHPALDNVEKQLEDYFSGKRKKFRLLLDPQGTDFQKKAWQALLTIPYGETRTYAEQAQMMGHTAHHARAVGGANNKNPIPIIIPCHRVIGSNKKLVGYAGGLKIKEQLLRLES